MRVAIVFVLLAGLDSTISNLLLKQSRMAVAPGIRRYEKFCSLYFIGAIVFYLINLTLFTMALDGIPASVGYPILAASGFAMLAILAAILLGERFGRRQVIGLLLVVTAISVLAQGK